MNKPMNQSNKSRMDHKIELFCKAHPAFSKLFSFVCLSVAFSGAFIDTIESSFFISLDRTFLLTILFTIALIFIYGLLSETVDEFINSDDSETQFQEKPEKITQIIYRLCK